MIHAILIAPADFREAGNALGESLGHGQDTYSVPLYPAGVEAEAPTHYAAASPVTDAFVALVSAAEAGIIPPELEALGYTGAGVQALVMQLIFDFSNIAEEPMTHFLRVLGVLGLSRYPFFPE